MPLRPQQQKLKDTVDEILVGAPIKNIFLFWVPGGGKSLAPVILSDLLIRNRKQLIIVPRNALKQQMESDYNIDFYPVDKTCRIADNAGDPFRGCSAAVTTYQAIGANPEKWIEICKKYEIMLIFDEFHHLSGQGEWISAIKPMADNSFLRVFMTGTITRGDNTKLPFVPYTGDKINFNNTMSNRWIIYSQEQALKDGSVLPYDTTLLNGSGRYRDNNGIERSFDKFGTSGDHLRTAFKTEYAYHLLDLAIKHWLNHLKTNPWAKLLIVSPNIDIAKEYLEYVTLNALIQAGIATSDENSLCKENIKRFKSDNWNFKALNCLVTVAVAYEGLSVPPVSHMAVMTLIRSEPWLQQCLGRCTRNYPTKKIGYVFAPEDPKMLAALKNISSGIIHDADGEPVEKSEPDPDREPSEGGDYNGGIEALSSEAHLDDLQKFREFIQAKNEPEKQESQSEKEHRLRKEINSVINKIVGSESAGNRKVVEKIFWLKVKQICNKGRDEKGKLIRKPLKEMTVKELQKVADFSKNYA